jgi:hypothetical protein
MRGHNENMTIWLAGADSPPRDFAADYVTAENTWREARDARADAPATRDAARGYIAAIDAYVAVLRSHGRQVPHHLDEVANTLRIEYADL